jgi:hypothetical protein
MENNDFAKQINDFSKDIEESLIELEIEPEKKVEPEEEKPVETEGKDNKFYSWKIYAQERIEELAKSGGSSQ